MKTMGKSDGNVNKGPGEMQTADAIGRRGAGGGRLPGKGCPLAGCTGVLVSLHMPRHYHHGNNSVTD